MKRSMAGAALPGVAAFMRLIVFPFSPGERWLAPQSSLQPSRQRRRHERIGRMRRRSDDVPGPFADEKPTIENDRSSGRVLVPHYPVIPRLGRTTDARADR